MILSKYAIPSLTVSVTDIKNRIWRQTVVEYVIVCDFIIVLLSAVYSVFYCVYYTVASA